jgi:hypothetical protein
MSVSAGILTEDFPDPVIPITLSLCECPSSSRMSSTHRMMKSGRICTEVGMPLLTIEVEMPPRVVVPRLEVEVHSGVPRSALVLDVRWPL